MKKTAALICTLSLLFLNSCGDDDDSPSVDFREAFIGTYQLDVLDGSTFQTDFSIQFPPEIEVSYDPSIKEDELFMDLEPFVESILEELTFLQFNTRDILRAQIGKDEQLAELNGTQFELEDVELVVTYTSAVNDNDVLVCELNMSGQMDGSVISFDYDMLVIGQNISYTIEGSSSGAVAQ